MFNSAMLNCECLLHGTFLVRLIFFDNTYRNSVLTSYYSALTVEISHNLFKLNPLCAKSITAFVFKLNPLSLKPLFATKSTFTKSTLLNP